MEIQTILAQQIIDQLKDIVNQEMNFIAIDGTIIASTDKDRIGTNHGGSHIVLNTGSNLVIEEDNIYKNSKKGINLPVIINNDIVGIIGITGEKEEVEPFGKIIKKMTELLIKENELQKIQLDKRNNYKKLIDEFVSPNTDYSAIQQLSEMLNLRMDISRFFIIGRFKLTNPKLSDDIIDNFLKQFFLGSKQTVFSVRPNSIVIIQHSLTLESIEKTLNTLINQLHEKFDIHLKFGIGTMAMSIPALIESYANARTTLDWNNRIEQREVISYDKLGLGLLLTKIDDITIDNYLDKILGELSTEELMEYKKIVSIYEKNNGSITKAAEELFIHKNTLQKKIIRLKKITHLDLRNLADYLTLALAFKFIDT